MDHDNELDPLDPAQEHEAAAARIAPVNEADADKIAALELEDALGRVDLGVGPVQSAPVADIADLPDGSGSEQLDEVLGLDEAHELTGELPPVETDEREPSIQDFLDTLDDDDTDLDELPPRG